MNCRTLLFLISLVVVPSFTVSAADPATQSWQEFNKDLSDSTNDLQKELEQRKKTDPGYYHRKKGDEYFQQGNYLAAVQEYDTSLTYINDDPSTYYQKGVALVQLRDFQSAIRVFDKAIAISNRGKQWEAWPNMYKGFAYGYLKQFDKAIQAFTASIQAKPMLNAYIGRAAAYGELGNFDAAIKDYDSILEIEPTAAAAWTTKGLAHIRKSIENPTGNHFELACASFKKACEFGDCRGVTEYTECKGN